MLAEFSETAAKATRGSCGPRCNIDSEIAMDGPYIVSTE